MCVHVLSRKLHVVTWCLDVWPLLLPSHLAWSGSAEQIKADNRLKKQINCWRHSWGQQPACVCACARAYVHLCLYKRTSPSTTTSAHLSRRATFGRLQVRSLPVHCDWLLSRVQLVRNSITNHSPMLGRIQISWTRTKHLSIFTVRH